jgi:uncharacterized protein
MIRAVLDTNVIVSSVLSLGAIPHRIIRAWKSNFFELALSNLLLKEFEEVLHRPVIRRAALVSETEIAELLAMVGRNALLAPEPLSIRAIIADDPDDDVVLATALACHADFREPLNIHFLLRPDLLSFACVAKTRKTFQVFLHFCAWA